VSNQRTATPAALKNKLVCDLLLRDRLIRPDQAESVLTRTQRSGERAEEAVLELGMLSEPELLKALAMHYKVNFVSVEKLAKVEVARGVRELLSQRFVDKSGICPVLYDAKQNVLTVLTADPDDFEQIGEAQLVSGAREIKTLLARPAGVKAFVAKTYLADTLGFAVLERQAQISLNAVAVSGFESGRATYGDGGGSPPAPAPRETSRARRDAATAREPSVAPPPVRPAPPAPKAPPPPAAVAAPVQTSSDRKVSDASFVELLHVLVSLLEGAQRSDLRGHSGEVARLMRRMAEKLNLDPGVTAMLVAAAFIHDLGKMGQYHLTPLNCAEYEGHKVAAQKGFELPARLLDPVRLPAETLQAATRMYERYDGKGFPDGIGGKDIPLGARMLAICDTYADLTLNPRNPFRKTLAPPEACVALAKHKDGIFDPNLVDLFRNMVLGEELTAKLLANRSQALLVDVDPEETTVLELRMVEQGFVVKTARSVEQALKILGEGSTDLVVSEIELGAGDGLALLAEARAQPWGKDMPWVIYSRRQERAVAQKAFELGVLDYVGKPASADVLVAKLKALLEKTAASPTKTTRGVSGSLREMGLPDMVQVLFHGRKSGRLTIRAPDGTGEIHFAEGAIFDAVWGDLRGDTAFYAMLKLTDGDFALDPSFKATNRTINQSAEALLLEGMRRLDEGI
jgi:response regulator RpfG family c-di-GMP phosphodiesterase